MTDFDEELAQLRAEVVVPDATATRRVAARLSHSIGAAAVGQAGSARAFLWARPLQLVTSFVLGGIVGAGVYGALRPPRLAYVTVERPLASVEAPVASAAPVPNPAFELAQTPPAAPVSLRTARLTPSASAGGERLASLAEQQALLDVARAEFARSDYAATLRTLAAHSARFPRSVLSEEREALQIKALAAGDRVPEARSLAARFQTRYPRSLLLPSVKDSVGTIP